MREIVGRLMAEHEAEVNTESRSHLLADELGKPTSQNADASNRLNGRGNSSNHADGGKPLGSSKRVPEIRKGVKPGSFIDLLVKGGARSTGRQFTKNEKSEQVFSPSPLPSDPQSLGCRLCDVTVSENILSTKCVPVKTDVKVLLFLKSAMCS